MDDKNAQDAKCVRLPKGLSILYAMLFGQSFSADVLDKSARLNTTDRDLLMRLRLSLGHSVLTMIVSLLS